MASTQNNKKAKNNEEEDIQIDKIDPESILSEDEKRAAKESFDAYDKLGYGTLEAEEL